MNTVTFRTADGVTKNSYTDLGLLLRPKKIAPPAPKIIKMAIDGRDGDIDLTEWAGEVRYNDRTFTLSFYMTCALHEIETRATEIKNWLHGQRVQITLADDAAYYYAARVSVSDARADGGLGLLEMSVTAEPYKYKQAKTVVNAAIDGTKTLALTNDRMSAMPRVTVGTDTSLRIEFETLIWDLGSGTYDLPELILRMGENAVTVTGNGSVSFEWQEGAL